MRKHKQKFKDKRIPYQQLRDCYVFRFIEHGGGVRLYTKITDSVALDERTGKDAIFAPNDRVEPLYPVACDLI